MPFHIVKACHRKWSSFEGDGPVRHCKECRRNVYDLSAFTDSQMEELGAGRERVCGYGPLAPRRTMLGALITYAAGLNLFGQESVPIKDWEVLARDKSGAVLDRVSFQIRPSGESFRGGESETALLTFLWKPGQELVVSCPRFLSRVIPILKPPVEKLQVVLDLDPEGGYPGVSAETLVIQTSPSVPEPSSKRRKSLKSRLPRILQWIIPDSM